MGNGIPCRRCRADIRPAAAAGTAVTPAACSTASSRNRSTSSRATRLAWEVAVPLQEQDVSVSAVGGRGERGPGHSSAEQTTACTFV